MHGESELLLFLTFLRTVKRMLATGTDRGPLIVSRSRMMKIIFMSVETEIRLREA